MHNVYQDLCGRVRALHRGGRYRRLHWHREATRTSMNAAVRRAGPPQASTTDPRGTSEVRAATSARVRSHGWTDYQERIGRVTAYIHDHLADELDLNRLAEVAHLSPYHWHRVYHALHGETIAATVRRLRLHRASGYLANTTMAVAQIARKCGYPNAQSFTRAFGSAYGMSPAHYRVRGSHAVFRVGQAQPEAAGYKVDVRQVPAVRLAGMEHKGSYMLIGKAFGVAYTRLAA